ncbi:MAG: acyltransferase family protein [Deltaproteobacteria bacterium]|nr:acyltransferase family protein [Deltaproteobacteria bacterium]
MNDDDPVRDALGRLKEMAGKWLSPEVPVDDKLREFSEILGAPLNEADDSRTDLIDPDFVKEQYGRLETWGRIWFRQELSGTEHIPPAGQGAVLVSNHAILALDSLFLFERIYHETGRIVRPTVDKNSIRVPYFRQWMQKLGAVYGSRENAVHLCKSGELTLSYPGGAREALKPTRDRYALYWEKSLGFVKVAVEAGVPIIPVASIGGDDAYVSLLEDNVLVQRLLGTDKYKMPLYLGLGLLPLPVKLRFVVGEPVYLNLPPWKADDDDALWEIQNSIKEKLELMIEEELVRRGRGI